MPNQIQKIIDKVEKEYQMGGLSSGLYADFTKDVVLALLRQEIQELEEAKKEENKALSNGTNQEIEFLFRNGDIGVTAQHYRNVGFNSALSDLITKKKQLISELNNNYEQ